MYHCKFISLGIFRRYPSLGKQQRSREECELPSVALFPNPETRTCNSCEVSVNGQKCYYAKVDRTIIGGNETIAISKGYKFSRFKLTFDLKLDAGSTGEWFSLLSVGMINPKWLPKKLGDFDSCRHRRPTVLHKKTLLRIFFCPKRAVSFLVCSSLAKTKKFKEIHANQNVEVVIPENQWLPIEIGNDLKAGKLVSYAKINGELVLQSLCDEPYSDLDDVFHHVGSLFKDYAHSPFTGIQNYVYSAYNNPVAPNEACHNQIDNSCKSNRYSWSEWSTCENADKESLGFQTSRRSDCICPTGCDEFKPAMYETKRQPCNHQVTQPTKMKIEIGHSTEATNLQKTPTDQVRVSLASMYELRSGN